MCICTTETGDDVDVIIRCVLVNGKFEKKYQYYIFS